MKTNHDQASARLSPDSDLVGDDGLACVCQPDHERHTRQRQAYRPIGKPVSLVAPILRRPLDNMVALGARHLTKGSPVQPLRPPPPPLPPGFSLHRNPPALYLKPRAAVPLAGMQVEPQPGSYTLDLVLSRSSQPHRVGKRARPRPRRHLETAAPWTVPRLGPLICQLG